MDDEKRAWRERIELKKRSRVIKKRARRVEGATVRHARRFLVNRWDKIREVRLRIIFWLGGVGLLIALVGLQMVWFQKSYVSQAAVSGGTYAEALKGPIDTLNPLYASTPAEVAASRLLFSSLYTYDTSGHVHGDIATGLTNENNKVFTIKLRHDARWQDGQKLTADDVAFTVNLMKNPAARSTQASSWQGIDAQVLDAYTVKFTLPASYAPFLQALTFAILPQHLLQSANVSALRESTFSSAPIGSGPFKLRLLQVVNQTDGRKIAHLDASDMYYQGRPRIDHLQLHAYSDDESIGRALRTSEVSGASDVTSDIARSVDTNRYEIEIHSQNNGVYALFNLNQPVLKDANVRKALQMGTDTNAIRAQVYGHPEELHLPFMNDQVPGADAIPAPEYDSAAAAKLLSDSGWVMQNGVRAKGADKLRLRVVTSKNGDYEKALQLIVGQWRQLGVQVDTQVYDPSDPGQSFTSEVLQQRNYDVLLDELQVGGDPDVFAYWHSRGQQNFSNYGNPVSDDALSSARATSDPVLRGVKYTAFAKQWLADVPAIGLYQSNFIYPHLKATHILDANEKIVNGDEHYAGVRYWAAQEGAVYKTP
jgi:peptide/nickel transport system substrate-binding protein